MNPWQSAAESYQQGLQGLGQVQQQGYRDMANAPMKLYQMFMEGYEKARARKMQEEQLARQNHLADIQEQRANEQERQNKMLNRMKIAEYVSKTLRGDKQSFDEVMGNLKGSGFEDLVPQPIQDQGGEELAGRVRPGEPQPKRLPNLQYPMGSSYRMQMEKEAQDKDEFDRKQTEAERKAKAQEEDRDLQRAQVLAMFQQGQVSREQLARMSDDTKRWLGGMMAQTRMAQMDDKISRERDKLDAKYVDAYNQERNRVEGLLGKVGSIRDSVDSLLKAPGLEGISGAEGWMPDWPGGDAANARAKYDFIRSAETLRGLTELRAQSKTGGALGNVSDKDMEILMNSIGELKNNQSDKQFKENLKKLSSKLEDIENKAREGFVGKWEGGGGPSPRPKALPGLPPKNNGKSKPVVSREYSPSRNKTRITYSDGTTEILDGKVEQ